MGAEHHVAEQRQLHAARTEPLRQPHAVPCRRRLRRLPAQRTERRRGIRNALEFVQRARHRSAASLPRSMPWASVTAGASSARTAACAASAAARRASPSAAAHMKRLVEPAASAERRRIGASDRSTSSGETRLKRRPPGTSNPRDGDHAVRLLHLRGPQRGPGGTGRIMRGAAIASLVPPPRCGASRRMLRCSSPTSLEGACISRMRLEGVEGRSKADAAHRAMPHRRPLTAAPAGPTQRGLDADAASTAWISSSRSPRVSMPARISSTPAAAISKAISAAASARCSNKPSTPRPAPRMPPNLELAAITPAPVPRRCTRIDFRRIGNQHRDHAADADQQQRGGQAGQPSLECRPSSAMARNASSAKRGQRDEQHQQRATLLQR